MNQTVRIFVSHSSTYVELAKRLKLSLKALESGPTRLDIRISEEMAGATDWREWIEENARSADMFLFLYPHMGMKLDWCSYELGRFYDPQKTRYVVCLKNGDIPKPPPMFEPYQAYGGDRDGLLKFLRELFVEGVFSDHEPLNAEVGKVGTDHYKLALEVAQELSELFAQARVRERLYDRRIEITLQFEGDRLDPARTLATGNAEGLELIGLEPESRISWAQLRMTLGNTQGWPQDLEQALPGIALGALPPALSPFRRGREIYVPVISRVEDADGRLQRIAVIFVGIAGQNLLALGGWATPPAMPENFAELIRLVRTLLRVRWEVLEPRLASFRYREMAEDQCAAAVASIQADFEQLARASQQRMPMGAEAFRNLFDRSLRPQFDQAGKAFEAAWEALKACARGDRAQAAAAVEKLMVSNALWLNLTARQFTIHVGDLTLFAGGTVSAERSPGS